MRFLKRVKSNSNPILYKGYMKKIELEEKKQKLNRKLEQEQKSNEKLEQKRIERNKKNRKGNKKLVGTKIKLEINGIYSIAVCSLENQVGCTYFAITIAKYFNSFGKRTCVISNEEACNYNKLNIDFDIDIITKKQFEKSMKYDVVIYDIGYSDLDKYEIFSSQVKIMIGKYSEKYLMKLHNFIKETGENDKKWKYIYNMVAMKDKKSIDDLMEDYEYYCLPLYLLNDHNVDVDKILSKLFMKKGRRKL